MTELTQELGLDVASFSTTIRPQDDFYRYVNSSWISTHEIPADYPIYGSFMVLHKDSLENVRAILDDDTIDNCKVAKALYKSFMNTDRIAELGMKPLEQALHMISSASSKEELLQVLAALQVTGDGASLFDIDVYADPGNPTVNTAFISQAGLGLPDEAYYREEQYAPIREQYRLMIQQMFMATHIATTEEEAQAFAQSVYDIEATIAQYHWNIVDRRDSQKTYNPKTWDELVALSGDFSLQQWCNAWQESYNSNENSSTYAVNLQEVLQHIVVCEPSYIEALGTIWSTHDLEAWKYYAMFHNIIGFARFLPDDIYQVSFNFYSTTLQGVDTMQERWKRGVQFANSMAGEDIGPEYIRRHFSAESKTRMETLVENLIEAYRASITASTWLTDNTKTAALDKLDKFTPMIAYPEVWRDYSALQVDFTLSPIDNVRATIVFRGGESLAKAGKPVDKREWLMNVQEVNAYYEPTTNVIVFPTAILQPPFFQVHADDAVNYGAIGAVIGHEIGHGFDDQGSQYTGEGRLENWWTDEDRKQFEERTKALIAQYDAFTPLQLLKKYEAENKAQEAPHVNGSLTIGENIGDLGGVTIALKAYALSLGATNGTPEAIAEALEKAPIIDGLTGLQRFFLSYASIWRSKVRDEYAEQLLAIDPHSPAEFRTNGIVRNVDAFYDAFNVTADDDMWLAPEARVTIW